MLFTQFEFIVFFNALLLLLTLLKSRTYQKVVILFASYYFYSYWDYRFAALLIFLTLSNYFLGICIEVSLNFQRKKMVLWSGLGINLGMLGLFKYYDFFLVSIKQIPLLNNFNLQTLDLILPLGISFYVFRFISYMVDVYRGEIESCRNIIDFAVYAAFFPIVTSGPIARASSFLPQLNSFSISIKNIYAGYRLFVIGMFLKIFVADRLAPFVNHFYDNFNVFDTVTAWLAVTAYSLQIYCDFAGYSNMAIGLALMMGFNIEKNFDFPYLATSIRDFWRRWHITLSTWIRDYIYFPLGGNRKGLTRTYINLLLTMSLCGLWHGAAGTFIVWGFLHGAALVVNHGWRKMTFGDARVNPALISVLNWFITLIFVTLGWVFFRSESVSQAILIINNLLLFNDGIAWYNSFVIFILLATGCYYFLVISKVQFVHLPLNARYTPAVLFCLIWLVIVFSPRGFHPFMYFQF